jgi:hypothetical protein
MLRALIMYDYNVNTHSMGLHRWLLLLDCCVSEKWGVWERKTDTDWKDEFCITSYISRTIFLVVLGIEFRALKLLSKHCTTWATPPVLLLFVCSSNRFLCFATAESRSTLKRGILGAEEPFTDRSFSLMFADTWPCLCATFLQTLWGFPASSSLSVRRDFKTEDVTKDVQKYYYVWLVFLFYSK